MKSPNIAMIALGLIFSQSARADDIEIYFGESAAQIPYLHFLLDPIPSADSFLCTMDDPDASAGDKGGDGGRANNLCSESMSPEAFLHLQSLPDSPVDVSYAVGDRVDFFGGFKAVIAAVLSNLEFDDIYMAIVSANTDTSTNPAGGGVILEGYKRLGDHRTELIDTIKSVPVDHEQVMPFQPKEASYEWWLYLNGKDVDLGTGTQQNYGMATPIPNYDVSIIKPGSTNGTYISPFSTGDCPALYQVVVAMNPDNKDEDRNAQIRDTTSGMGAEVTVKNLTQEFSWMLDWMHQSDADLASTLADDLSISKTWVIGDGSNQSSTKQWLQKANLGTNKELLLTEPIDLQADLEAALAEIVSVSSTFVSASVPVNVFNQAHSLDNLFVALFEARNTIAWPGNIKKLKLVDDPSDIDGSFDQVLGANGQQGFETTGPNKGRISFGALTYWVDAGELPDADAPGIFDPNVIAPGVDGRVVDRGGAGQKIPGVIQGSAFYPKTIGDSNSSTTRTIYIEAHTVTNNPESGANLDDFNVALALSDPSMPSLLGATDVTEAEELIKWARGQDLSDFDGDGETTDARFWVMADAIHSRPFALNYGVTTGHSKANPDIKLLFGTGDGMFHVVENTIASVGDNESGEEVFSFIPRELLGQFKRRMQSEKMGDGRHMRYGVDGEPVVLTLDANNDGSLIADDKDAAYVYFGLRRGGYGYYALDIIDAANPVLQWKIYPTRDDANNSTFDELGLTFSTPVLTAVKYKNEAVDALIFGGGYHGGPDTSIAWDPGSPGAVQIGKDINADDDPWGNAIYIVNAITGELIWKATKGSDSPTDIAYKHPMMVDSIPSKVTVLENASGVAHRVYVGDTGGTIWRVDLPVANEDDDDDENDREDLWFISRFADLTPNGEDLRFFHPPSIVEAKTATKVPFDGVLIQSGNRADPLDKRFAAAENHIFYLRDYNTTSGIKSAVIADGNDPNEPQYYSSVLANLTGCPDASPCEDLKPQGWKVKMMAAGEKGLSTPVIDAGRLFNTTYIPGTDNVCGKPAEGRGRLYVLDLVDASATGSQRIYDLGPGIPSEPVLIGDVIWLPGGGIEEDLDGDGINDGIFTKSFTERLVPIYWREPGFDDLK